jgi:hypothetical protein
VKRPLCIVLWTTAAVVFAVALWFVFRHREPGELALSVVGKTGITGEREVIFELTNSTATAYRVIFVGAERWDAGAWMHDPYFRTVGLIGGPQHVAAYARSFLMLHLPEPRARERYTVVCAREGNRLEEFLRYLWWHVSDVKPAEQVTLNVEVEP